MESRNALNDLSSKLCFLNQTEYLNLSLFSIITRINELKTLLKHISCKCKCRFDGRKCHSNQWWNSKKCRCECKKHICGKDYISNPATYSCRNGNYLTSIINDSVITCDEIIDEEKETIATSFNETIAICKTKNFYILLAF